MAATAADDEPPTAAALLAGPPFAALSSALRGAPVRAVDAAPLGGGGLANSLTRLRVALDDGGQLSLVLKTHSAGTEARCAALGTAREAHFYRELAPRLRARLPPGALPSCHYAAGDMATGRKALLLGLAEGATESGLAFGRGSPLNWPRADAALAAAAALATPEGAAASAFHVAAVMHGAFWRDRSLLAHAWLRGVAWYQRPPAEGAAVVAAAEAAGAAGAGGAGGEQQESGQRAFAAAQAQAAASWADSLAGRGPSGSVQWAAEQPALARLMAASLGRVCWASFRARCAEAPWTLVHGDLHPGNVLLLPLHAGDGRGGSADSGDAATSQVFSSMLLDWEVVGVGSGPQDLGQYVVSHMEPTLRRGCEARLLRAYHAELLATVGATSGGGSSSGGAPEAALSFEACQREYAAGGVERWVWLLALLAGMCPPAMTRFWAAQLQAFAGDHGVTAAVVGQPRV